MQPPSVLRSATQVGGLTLASRILGLVRDVSEAALFGTGAVWDSFLLAWTLPNVMRRVLGEGALSMALVPELAAREAKGDLSASSRLTSLVVGRVGLFLLALTLLGVVGLATFALLPGVDGKLRLVAWYSVLLLPYMPLICLTAVLAAALQVAGRFGSSSAYPIVLNIVWIAALALLWYMPLGNETRAGWLAAAVLAGGAGGLAWLWWDLARTGRRLRPALQDPDRSLPGVWRRFGPSVAGLAALQLNVALDRVIAEWAVPGHGAVSALYFGNRMLQFPLSLVGFAIATAAYPAFSRAAARGDLEGLDRDLGAALRQTVFLGLPAAAGLCLLAGPVVEALFGRGAFGAESIARTSGVTAAYGPAVLFLGLQPILARAFHALGDPKTPVRLAVGSVVLNLGLNLALVGPFAERGLACATSAASAVQCLGLYVLFVRRYGLGMRRELAGTILKSGAACALMAGLVLAVEAVSGPVLAVVAGVGGGAVAYLGAAWVFGSAELAELRGAMGAGKGKRAGTGTSEGTGVGTGKPEIDP